MHKFFNSGGMISGPPQHSKRTVLLDVAISIFKMRLYPLSQGVVDTPGRRIRSIVKFFAKRCTCQTQTFNIDHHFSAPDVSSCSLFFIILGA